MPNEAGEGNNEAESDGGIESGDAVSTLKASLRPTYPEIDVIYSDAYIEAVLSVPERTYEYARDEKM